MSPSPKLNILVAFNYFTDKTIQWMVDNACDVRFLVDSGAFAVHRQGLTITVDEYCSGLARLPVQPWRYFTLDVIGDPVKTKQNYEQMLSRGFSPVPIITRGQSLNDMEHYYETSDVVALGGIAGVGKGAWVDSTVQRFINVANGRKVHVLGYSSFSGVKKFRPYSCDSSSFESSGRYGSMYLYIGNGRMLKLGRKDFLSRPSDEVQSAIRSIGFSVHDMIRESAWRGSFPPVRAMTYGSWIAYSMDVERKLGTKLFLASTPSSLNNLKQACSIFRQAWAPYKRWLGDRRDNIQPQQEESCQEIKTRAP